MASCTARSEIRSHPIVCVSVYDCFVGANFQVVEWCTFNFILSKSTTDEGHSYSLSVIADDFCTLTSPPSSSNAYFVLQNTYFKIHDNDESCIILFEICKKFLLKKGSPKYIYVYVSCFSIYSICLLCVCLQLVFALT